MNFVTLSISLQGTMDQPVDEIGEEACSGSGRGTSSGPAETTQEVSASGCSPHLHLDSNTDFSNVGENYPVPNPLWDARGPMV